MLCWFLFPLPENPWLVLGVVGTESGASVRQEQKGSAQSTTYHASRECQKRVRHIFRRSAV